MSVIRRLCGAALCCAALAMSGCSSGSKTTPSSAETATGERSKAGAFLAYEHKISVRFGTDLIAARENALRDACAAEKFGQCSLLGVTQTSGKFPSGEVTLRVAPDAVEPLVKLAAQDGVVLSRETRAEDLAEVVADTEQAHAALTRTRENFQHLQERRDASVADQLAVARELATLEAALDANAKTAAQQRRRIETNLLKFDLRVNDEPSRTGRIGDAFANLGDSLADGIAETVEVIGYGVPFLILAFVAALLWRWVWRKVTRRSAT